MQEINGQMVLKLHQLSGEPVANCHYLLTQTNGDYELALKILERILEQRKQGKDAEGSDADEELSVPAQATPADAFSTSPADPQTRIAVLEGRVQQLEMQVAQLTTTLDAVSDKLTMLVDQITGPD